jgi:hypothetical protein
MDKGYLCALFSEGIPKQIPSDTLDMRYSP